jgi:hypothetical protein
MFLPSLSLPSFCTRTINHLTTIKELTMPLRLSVGLSKKIGLPAYGSIGATCHVELELGHNVLHDPDGFQRHIRYAYSVCSQAIADELSRQTANQSAASEAIAAPSVPSASAPTSTPAAPVPIPRVHGNGNGNGGSNGNGNGHQASAKQLEYVSQLARQIKGLGVRRLEAMTSRMFNKPLVSLTSLEASSLIDTLKSAKSGDVNLDDIFHGAEA